MTSIYGIDPGTHTGYAWIHDGEIREVQTSDFWEVYHHLYRYAKREDSVIVIEQGGLNSPTFYQASNLRAQNKTSQRVGQANREAELLAAGLEKAGFQVVRVRPTKSKWDKATCQQITGYSGRTSEHARDALRLAYEYSLQVKLQKRVKK